MVTVVAELSRFVAMLGEMAVSVDIGSDMSVLCEAQMHRRLDRWVEKNGVQIGEWRVIPEEEEEGEGQEKTLLLVWLPCCDATGTCRLLESWRSRKYFHAESIAYPPRISC